MPVGTTTITRTFGTPTDRDKWTYSAWVKISYQGAAMEQGLFLGYIDASNYTELYITETGQLLLYNHLSGSAGGNIKTNRVFKDPSAFYHIQVVWDSGNAVEADRVKFYINGVQETSLATSTYPAIDTNSTINGDNLHEIGGKVGTFDFSGVMSNVQFVDGSALAPTEFGEVDATSGIWKIKTTAYATPGANGFFLKMEDRTNLDLDSSSNAATFSTTGNLTATYDNPSNNFATMNPLDNYYAASTFTNGNNTISTHAANKTFNTSTLAVASGKWYWEVKITTTASESAEVGIASVPSTQSAGGGGELNHSAGNYEYRSDGTKGNNNSNTSWGNTWNTDDDIVGVALDLDNSKLYFSKNGVWQESGDPTSGATGTGAAFTVTAPASQTLIGSLNAYTPALGEEGAQTDVFSVNFGNGYFGTTAVTSANADDAGIGAMEYDVPAGYYCLCTKNIKAYG
tara:strand:+ start:99 stop:1469 length:1371 start_codon:yes stop_codon:yes gene_type:complete